MTLIPLYILAIEQTEALQPANRFNPIAGHRHHDNKNFVFMTMFSGICRSKHKCLFSEKIRHFSQILQYRDSGLMKKRCLKTVMSAYAGMTKRRSQYDCHSSLMMKNGEKSATFYHFSHIYKGNGIMKIAAPKPASETGTWPCRSMTGLKAKY